MKLMKKLIAILIITTLCLPFTYTVSATMQSVLMGSEYPVMDTLHFLFQKFIPQFVTGRSLMLRLFLFA